MKLQSTLHKIFHVHFTRLTNLQNNFETINVYLALFSAINKSITKI